MSIGSFFHSVGAAFKKLFGSSTWERTAASTITYVAPLLETIVQLAAGSAAEQAVAKVIATVQSDLATVAAVVDGTASGTPHGTAVVVSALGSIKTNLSGLLSLAEVKNSGKVSQITTAVNLIVGEADAMLGAMPGASSAPPPSNLPQAA
jgi:hypothetical protein